MIDLGTPEYLPFELDLAGDRVALLRLSEADYRAASFLDQRILQPDSAITERAWTELDLPAGARRDAQYIFHIGNVGSTLISRLLGELPDVFALREPVLLRSFAEAPPGAPDFDRLTALLSRTWRPGQRANVKATSFTSEIADRLVPPGSKALFLYARPDRYLENILAGENSWQTLQALSPIRLARLQQRCPGLEADPAPMHDGLKAALGWACEMTSLDAAAARMSADTVLWLDFDTFLGDPTVHLAAIATHFGHTADEASIRTITEGPLMGRYSKALDYEYSPDLRRRILADARHRHAPAIRDGLNWIAGLAGRYPAVADSNSAGAGDGLMFRELQILSAAQVAELREIAASANFVDGRISNPHSKVKQNLQLHDEAAYDRSSQILTQAMYASEEFQNSAFPVALLPPMMCRYTSDMQYGAHADAAFLQLGSQALRSDLSATIFLSDPASYEGGALAIHLGSRTERFRGAPGTAIVYPSDMLHEVERVTAGERLVAITFIQSRIADNTRRLLLYDLNEVAALEGLGMKPENYARLQLVQANLLRHWGDKP